MAQQCLALKVIVYRAYFVFPLLLESVLNDWIQHLSNDGHRFDDSILPKFDEFPSLIQPASLGDYRLCGQEGIGKFVCRVISG